MDHCTISAGLGALVRWQRAALRRHAWRLVAHAALPPPPTPPPPSTAGGRCKPGGHWMPLGWRWQSIRSSRVADGRQATWPWRTRVRRLCGVADNSYSFHLSAHMTSVKQSPRHGRRLRADYPTRLTVATSKLTCNGAWLVAATRVQGRR